MRPLSKRGEMAYYVRWGFFTIPMLVIIFVTLTIWLSGVLSPKADTFNADAALLTYQILYTPQGLAAIDPSGRPLPGVILADRFTSNLPETIAATFKQSQLPMAADIIIGEHEFFYPSQTDYSHLEPFVDKTGPSSTISFTTTTVVLLRKGNVDTPTPVEVTVLRARGDS